MSEGVVIDARWLKTGIGRYTILLLQGIREHLRGVTVTCITQSRYVNEISPLCDRVILCDAGIYGVREQMVLPFIARGAAAFYSPHYNIPLLWKHPLLMTIHDLNHLLDSTYRSSWKARLYAKPILKRAVRRADIIITPSLYTKGQLEKHLGVPPSRVSVIPLSVAPCFERKNKAAARSFVAQEFGISRPFLLFVGNCAPNKNVPLLLASLAVLHSRREDAPVLVIAGGEAKWQPQIMRQARKLGIQGCVVWLGRLSDPFLAELYAGALMTVVPSLEEGFGLPVIESMACGTPVVCSQAASLPEVAGDAALFFSPLSDEQLSDAIEHLMDATITQEKLIHLGLIRAAHFSQKRFGERQAAAILEVLSQPGAMLRTESVFLRSSSACPGQEWWDK